LIFDTETNVILRKRMEIHERQLVLLYNLKFECIPYETQIQASITVFELYRSLLYKLNF